MLIDDFKDINPYVRMVKIKKASTLSGKWQDLDHVFTYILSGTAEFLVDGVKYHVKQGDVIIIAPFQTHVILSMGEEPLMQYIMHFDLYSDDERMNLRHQSALDRGDLPQLPEREKKMREKVFVTTVPELHRHELQTLFLKMYQEFSEKKSGSALAAKAYCIQLLLMSMRMSGNVAMEKEVPSLSWKHIAKAIEYINLNYSSEKTDNESISAAVGVTPNYLTKIFRAHLGYSLHQYVTHFRIEKAQELMNSSKYTITEIANKTGFSGIHVFSKTFRSVTGMSPSHFLASMEHGGKVHKDQAIHKDYTLYNM